MRGTAGHAAAPTARCKNVRRGNFMMLPPQSAACVAGMQSSRTPCGNRLHPPCEEVEGVNASLDGGRACGKTTRRANSLNRRANQFYKFVRLTRQEERIAIVTKRGMGCGGRGGIVRAMGWQGGLYGP